MAFLTSKAIKKIPFKSIGKNVLISDKVSIYNPSMISIGNNSRIDDFCILSAGDGGISIGNHVHIACYVSLLGKGRIDIKDFAGVSSRTAVYSSTDDFSGDYLTGPTIPPQFTNVISGDVTIGEHVIIGAQCVILPKITIGKGAAIGAMSLVNNNCLPFIIYAGVPIRKIGIRKKKLLQLEKKFILLK